MPEDNVNTSFGGFDMTPTVKAKLREIGEQRKQLKKTADESSMNDLIDGSQQLDAASYNTNNQNLSKNYKKNSQMAAVAYMVKYAANRTGSNWNENTVSDIMSKFYTLNNNPEVVNKITDFINSDRDPEEFGIEMGWIPTDIEDNMNVLEKIFFTDWRDFKGDNMLMNAIRGIKYGGDVLAQGIQDFVGGATRALDGEEGARRADQQALDDYAYRKYGKETSHMNEEEIRRLELDMALENAKNGTYIMGDGSASYSDVSPVQSSIDRQRMDIGAVEMLAGGFLEGLSLAYPGATTGISLAASMPIVKYLFEGFAAAGYGLGYLATMIPGVNDWIESLPEDVQEEVRTIGGNTILGIITGKAIKAGRPYVAKNPKVQNLINGISSSEVISLIKKTYDKMYDKSGEWAYNVGDKLGKLRRGENKPKEQGASKEKTSLWGDFVRDAGRDLKPVGDLIDKGIQYTRDNLIDPAIERKRNQGNWERRMNEVTDEAEIETIKGNINKKSGEITNADSPETRQRVTNTLGRLSNIDRETFSQQKDLGQLSKTINEKLEKPVIETEDRILQKDKSLVTKESVEQKYGGQELVTDDATLGEVSSSTGPTARGDVINKAFNSFFDMAKKTEGTKSTDTSAMENLWKKYNEGGGLTSLELYKIARYLTNKFRIFQRDGSGTIRDTVSAQYINDLRTAIKNIAKDNIRSTLGDVYANYLDVLDKFYSDAAVTNDLLSRMYKDALKEENKIPSKTYAQEKVSSIPTTITQIKNMGKDILGGGDKNTPYSVNSELNYKLKLFDEDFDMLGRKVEGPSLEDIIKAVDELGDLETTGLSTKNKTNYYNNAMLELKEFLKALGYSEEKINAEIDKLKGQKFIEEGEAYKEYDKETKSTKSKTKRELTNLQKQVGGKGKNNAGLFAEE